MGGSDNYTARYERSATPGNHAVALRNLQQDQRPRQVLLHGCPLKTRGLATPQEAAERPFETSGDFETDDERFDEVEEDSSKRSFFAVRWKSR